MSSFRERVQAIQTELSAIADEVSGIQSAGPGTPFTGGDPTVPSVFTPDPPPIPNPVPPPAVGWWRPINARTSFPPLAPGDYAGAQEYAAFGYLPNGTLALSADRLDRARTQADLMSRATDAADANRLIAGAGGPGIEQDAVIYAIMIGRVNTDGAQNPNYSFAIRTIAEWVTYLETGTPPVPGQGPGTGF